MNKFLWKAWLRINLLITGKKYSAAVATVSKKALRNADLARLLIAERSEIKYETLLYILDQVDRIIREQLQLGNSVLTGTAQFTPRITGVWDSPSAKFNPAVHKVGLHIIPSAEMRAAFKDISVEVLGVKDGGAYIGLITDSTTGLADGTMNSGEVIVIEGEKIKIAPDDDDRTGIFFVNTEEEAVPVTQRFVQNDPKKVIAIVPELPAGQYTLRVVTRFTNGASLLKEPRVIDYDRPLVVN